MLPHRGESPGKVGAEGETHRLDVAALSPCGAGGELARPARRRPGFRNRATHLQCARSGGMRQGKVRIGGEHAVQRPVGADIAGQERIHRGHVILDRSRRPGAEGQAVAILRRSRALRSRDGR